MCWSQRSVSSSAFFPSARTTLASLLLLIILLAQPPPYHADDDRVTLSLYYEALCPYCANFIVNSLSKAFERDLISIVRLRLVPWGNGWIRPDGSMVCQHGPDECLLNAIEACAISIYPDVSRHFNFISCVERLTLEGRHSEWSKCLQTTGMSNTLIDCYNGGYGIQFERKSADETAHLNPSHRFVPWVLVNDQPLQEDYGNFASYVCNAYRGNRVPEACRSLAQTIDSSEKATAGGTLVCYASEAQNVTSISR